MADAKPAKLHFNRRKAALPCMLGGLAAALAGAGVLITAVPPLAFAGASLVWLLIIACGLLTFGGAVAILLGLLFLIPDKHL